MHDMARIFESAEALWTPADDDALISVMRAELRRHGLCRSYKGDFLHDVRVLRSGGRAARYIWAPNHTGTHLIEYDGPGQLGLARLLDIIETGFEGTRWYVIDGSRLIPVDGCTDLTEERA